MTRQQKYSIQDWRAEMAEIEQELVKVKADLKYTVNRLKQPPAKSTKTEHFAFYLNKGIAASGILWTGYKVYRRLRKIQKFFSFW